VINALDNIRAAIAGQRAARRARDPARIERLLRQASRELGDAIAVLEGAGLHPDAQRALRRAQALNDRRTSPGTIGRAIRRERFARGLIAGP
jgi:hypothetical protein